MNKMRKLSALLCAGALIVTAVLPVYAETGTSTGNGAVENMGEQGISFDAIVLPTVADGTFNFTLDPEKLLEQYSGYTNSGNFVFESKDTTKPATLTIKDGVVSGNDGKVYVRGMEIAKKDGSDNDGLAKLLTATTGAGDGTANSGTVSAVTAGLYVWVPDTAKAGQGKEVEITKDNITTYFDLTYDTTGAKPVTAVAFKTAVTASNVCAKNVYQYKWTDISTLNIDDYVTVGTDGAVTIKDGVTLAADASGTKTVLTGANLTYTKAGSKFSGTSDKVKIVNKSSKDKTVKVKVTVNNPNDGIEFVEKDTPDLGKAAVSLKITGTDNATPTANAKSAYVKKQTVAEGEPNVYSTEVKWDLDGTDIDDLAVVYTDGKDSIGSNIYKSYLAPVDASGCMYAEFQLIGATSDATSDADTKAAWNKYAKDLRAASTVTTPGVSVVYTIKDKVDVISTTGATELTDEVMFDDPNPNAWINFSTVDPTKITDIQLSDGTDVYNVSISDCTIDGTWLLVPYNDVADATTVTMVFKDDTKTYTQKLW